MFYVYVLKSCRTGRLYTGQTKDLTNRILRHNSGGCISTYSGRPYEIVHVESFNTRSEAMRRESFLKTGKGRLELKFLGL